MPSPSRPLRLPSHSSSRRSWPDGAPLASRWFSPHRPLAGGRFLPLVFGLLCLVSGDHSAAAKSERTPSGHQVFDGCTTLAIGKEASADGSVMVTHTCDGHNGRTWIEVVPHRRHEADAKCWLSNRTDLQVTPGDTTGLRYDHWIPQVPETYGYLWGIYPLMNEHQLAIGESTFGGKEELRSDQGLINCYELTRLMAERCRTAREAIALADTLLARYGYNDGGECLILADKQEVWLFEVIGPGAGKVGAVWAAKRVPDGHLSMNANMSRIREIDLEDPDCLVSVNVFTTAEELGLWDPASGQPFEFCYVYASRQSMAGRRREWRVLDLLAPSLASDPNGENFPFSVRPDTLVSVLDLMELYEDTYEDTPFDMTKYMRVADAEGKWVKSPYANPFLNYDQMPLWKITGGWNEKGERTIARFYCIYVFIAQSRAWLPDPIGGLVWFGWDNPAMTCYAPIYNCVTELPPSFRLGGPDGRPRYTRQSAWWAFNRAATIASHRWGDMRYDVYAVRDPLLQVALTDQAAVEEEALALYVKKPQKGIAYLTDYSLQRCNAMVEAYWNLGDDLWTKYDEKF